MRRQGTAVWDGANVAGPDAKKDKDIHCPLMGTYGNNYWLKSCQEQRQHNKDSGCPKSCKYKIDK